jgi:hypothetical protein
LRNTIARSIRAICGIIELNTCNIPIFIAGSAKIISKTRRMIARIVWFVEVFSAQGKARYVV